MRSPVATSVSDLSSPSMLIDKRKDTRRAQGNDTVFVQMVHLCTVLCLNHSGQSHDKGFVIKSSFALHSKSKY